MSNSSLPLAVRLSSYMFLVAIPLGNLAFFWDFFLSATKDIPTLGVLGYLTGPIFAHKLSEILIVNAWLWFAYMMFAERTQRWPTWMPAHRYYRSLYFIALVVLWATVLAAYAWTILNFGTSARTTNLAVPPGLGEDAIVWRYYLAAVVVAGGAYVMLVLTKFKRLPAAASSVLP